MFFGNKNFKSLCTSCKEVRLIKNNRGSVFLLCLKSKQNNSYSKYPVQPVLSCTGYSFAEESEIKELKQDEY